MTKVTLEKAQHLLGEAKFQAYACLDTTGTREIFDNLIGKLDPERAKLYHWVRAQQGPALTMTLRGVALDKAALGKARSEVARELAKVIEAIQNNEHVRRVWDEVELNTGDCPHRPPRKSKKTGKESPGKHDWMRAPRGMPKLDPKDVKCKLCGAPRVIPKEFKPTSDDAVKKLLYEKFKAPKIFGKTGSVTTDGDALDKLILKGQRAKKWEFLIEVCELLKKVRDLAKQQGFLFAKIDENTPHPRYYSSFNVGAAWTGRFSSSQDPFKYGGNLQNIAEKNRHIFVPDPRYKMFYADLKTAESLLVAYTSGEEKYIEAHKGDVHTYVCREVWPELPWTGDIKQDKIIATSNYPPWDPAPGHDYRFQSKRVQHGSNYGLTPFGMAMIAHIPVEAARESQQRYFRAFPGIQEWQRYIIGRVERQLPLRNPFGRVIRLIGRPRDPHTHKQGLAFGPQSGIAELLNAALWRVWRRFDPELIQVLAQVHDAILGQYLEEREDEALRALKECMEMSFPVTDIHGVTRICTIPVEIAVGYNWGKASESNPNGLKEVKGPFR